jgi:hypothetical protein
MSLTVTPRTHHDGHRLYDTWEIANVTDSLVVLLAVEVAGAHTYDDSTGQIKPVPLAPNDTGSESGVTLRFDNQEQQATVGNRQAWSGVHIPPGSTLQATVLNNRELRLTCGTVDGPSADSTIVVRGLV